ncbi:hypothetical protein K4F52_007003 [Lecanicillium sp. MT-2017a]|nr:hypothetical protein K4F52_007003 [Lecanicillium sp. MT-2017a]
MIYLGGGGTEVDEARLLDLAFTPGKRVVIWPFAMPSNRWEGMKQWVTSFLASCGDFPSIELGTEEPDFGIADADIVVIPGGNTFRLLQQMQRHNMLSALRELLARGGKVYGGSAGALILGADIAIADASVGGQDENLVAIKDTKGLDVLGGCVVYPHFELGADSFQGHCERWAKNHGVVVLGMPENCGIAVDKDGGAVNAGPGDVYVFRPAGSMTTWSAGVRMDKFC